VSTRVPRSRRAAECDRHGGDIGKYRAACADDGAAAYGDTRRYEHIRRQPGLILHDHGQRVNAEVQRAKIVRGGTQVALLRNDGITADRYGAETVEHHVVTDPGEVADLHLPRIGHGDRGSNQHPFADSCAEQAQQPTSESEQRLRRGSEHDGLNQPPQLDFDGRAASKIRR